jgi:hypothetical protein
MREDEDHDDDLPPKVRLLRALVYALGVILAVGGAAVIALAFWRLAGTAENPAAPASSATTAAASALTLPQGASIVAMTLDGDRLALTLSVEGREEVRILNWRTGELLGTVVLPRKP